MDKILSEFYILDENHNPVPVEDHQAYYDWMAGRKEQVRRVAMTKFPDGTYISTVFLGMDHGWGLLGENPVLFETMVFSQGEEGKYCRRYTTWAAAEYGHKEIVADWALRILSHDFDD